MLLYIYNLIWMLREQISIFLCQITVHVLSILARASGLLTPFIKHFINYTLHRN
jgi:hypothetical protein